jgi:predicted ester cyclase
VQTSENETIVRALVEELFNGHDPSCVERLVVNRDLRVLAPALVRAFPDLYMEITHLLAHDDLVAVRAEAAATHTNEFRGLPPSGRTWEAACTSWYRLAGGRIVDSWSNWDWLEIYEAIGAVQRAGRAI